MSSYSKVAHADWVLHQPLETHGPADDPAGRTIYSTRSVSSSRAAAQARAAACSRQPRHVQLFRKTTRKRVKRNRICIYTKSTELYIIWSKMLKITVEKEVPEQTTPGLYFHCNRGEVEWRFSRISPDHVNVKSIIDLKLSVWNSNNVREIWDLGKNSLGLKFQI